MKYFKFKNFEIYQWEKTMPLTTDSVLLGAWVQANNAGCILDVGTGTGILALMMAQKFPDANVYAIEIDKYAYDNAVFNFQNNSFNNIVAVHDDFMNFARSTALRFDLVVSNPPFFVNQLKSPSEHKNIQKHNVTLNFNDFFAAVAAVLKPNGKVCFISSADDYNTVVYNLGKNQLFVNKLCYIKTVEHKAPSKIMYLASFMLSAVEKQTLTLRLESDFSPEFLELTEPFYLTKPKF